jgi:DnaJ family protein C protein 13
MLLPVCSSDECLTSLSEFTVYKISERHEEPVRRILCLTESCLVERDPSSYSICSLKPLSDVSICGLYFSFPMIHLVNTTQFEIKIFTIIRDEENPQRFSFEYMSGVLRAYTSTDRDSLLATVLDGVRASGNRDVFIKMKETQCGFRIGSFGQLIDEEIESLHLKSLNTLPDGTSFVEMMTRFNVNIPYSGIINAVTQDVTC